MNKNTLVINLWGGPGAPKNAYAEDLESGLVAAGFSVQVVVDYVEYLKWDDICNILDGSYNNQLEILKMQIELMEKNYGNVDFLITTAPLLANVFALIDSDDIQKAYFSMVKNYHNCYNNSNLFIRKSSCFDNIYYNETETAIKFTMDQYGIEYKCCYRNNANISVKECIDEYNKLDKRPERFFIKQMEEMEI